MATQERIGFGMMTYVIEFG
uniref:Uncharacterized protein n=1 Tax=Arundo donax TaxID=35708 RepID=A0A0A9BPB0_ARUDO